MNLSNFFLKNNKLYVGVAENQRGYFPKPQGMNYRQRIKEQEDHLKDIHETARPNKSITAKDVTGSSDVPPSLPSLLMNC